MVMSLGAETGTRTTLPRRMVGASIARGFNGFDGRPARGAARIMLPAVLR